MEATEKSRLEFYLSRLIPSLQTQTDALPTLDETLASYSQNAALREKLIELSQSDEVSRFYAALLLWAIDREKSEKILADLQDDETSLVIQKSIGHGAVEISIYLLAKDFLEQKSFPGENLSRVEELANWKAAVTTEKRRTGEAFDESSLPRYESALEALIDTERMQNLRVRIEKLKMGGAAERFYAAALIKPVDEREAQEILETLLGEPAEIGVLSGDIMLNFPASQIAAELLGRNIKEEISPENKNLIARFFKWLGG